MGRQRLLYRHSFSITSGHDIEIIKSEPSFPASALWSQYGMISSSSSRFVVASGFSDIAMLERRGSHNGLRKSIGAIEWCPIVWPSVLCSHPTLPTGYSEVYRSTFEADQDKDEGSCRTKGIAWTFTVREQL
jgi:hypothetical protein